MSIRWKIGMIMLKKQATAIWALGAKSLMLHVSAMPTRENKLCDLQWGWHQAHSTRAFDMYCHCASDFRMSQQAIQCQGAQSDGNHTVLRKDDQMDANVTRDWPQQIVSGIKADEGAAYEQMATNYIYVGHRSKEPATSSAFVACRKRRSQTS